MYNEDENMNLNSDGQDKAPLENFNTSEEERIETVGSEDEAITTEFTMASAPQEPIPYNPETMGYIPENTEVAKKAEKARRKQEKKAGRKHGFAGRVVAFSLTGIMVGALAGGAFYGVSYAGFALFPISSNEDSTTTTTSGAQVNATISDSDINTTVYDVSDMVASVITSVVAIDGTITSSVDYGYFGSQSVESTVSGSGIIIGTNDTELLIVTNAHVVDGVDNLAISFYDGSTADATVKGTKSSNDLAVLAVKLSDIPSGANYTIASLGDSDDVQVGEAAIAVGNSMGYGISVTTGVISALDKTVTVEEVDYENLIQTDAAINPGNSGGALFNANGEVIGINSVKMTDTDVEGMGYAISISSVKDIIEELSLQETKEQLSDDERGYLGVTGLSVTEEVASAYDCPVGVLVKSVSDGSAADDAGITKNDIITSFDGQTVTTIDELVDLMSYYAQGESVEVIYYHMNDNNEYEKQTTTVTLSEKPES